MILIIGLSSAVSAADDNTTDSVISDSTTDVAVEQIATTSCDNSLKNNNKEISKTTKENVKEEASTDVYVSPDVTEAQTGTQDNPTTITDALTKITDNATIHLQKGTNGIYPITQTITISDTTIPAGITSLKIIGDNVILDGQKTTQIMNIASAIDLTIENITFQNAYATTQGSAISTKTVTKLNLNNINAYNNSCTKAGIIYLNNLNAAFELNGKNNFINNTNTENGILYTRCKEALISGENLFKDNTIKSGALYISANSTINGNNIFINNIGTQNGALYVRGNSTISGTNTFINNSAKQGSDIFSYQDSLKITGNTTIINSTPIESSIYCQNQVDGEILISNVTFLNLNSEYNVVSISGGNTPKIFENNTFINCSSNIYESGNIHGSIIEIYKDNIKIRNNNFINSTTSQTIIFPYSKSDLTSEITNNTFQNIITNESIIYTQYRFNNIQYNNFINCKSENETIIIDTKEYQPANQHISDNTYINSTIKTNYTLELNENNPNPIKAYDDVNILIKDLTVAKPDFYDSDILNKTDITYEVYNNDKLLTVTEKTTDNFNFTPITPGEYQISTKSNLGSPSQNTLTINVEEKPLDTQILVVTPEENIVNKTTPITIQLLNENDELIPDSAINMTTSQKTEEIILTQGIVVIEYTPTVIGEDTIIFSYLGSDKLNPTNTTTILTVSEDKDAIIEELNNTLQEMNKDCILTIDNIPDIKFNDNLTVAGKLMDIKGIGIAGEKLTVTVNGADSTVTTDANGIWKLKIKTTTLGTNNVTATYTGTTYNPFTTSTTFEIAQTEAIITIDKIVTTQFRDNVTITGTFKNSNGKAIANSKVRVNVNGYSTYVTTDHDGGWSLTLKTNKTGINNVTASFSGNANYAKYTANATFNVTKQDLVITTEVTLNKGNFTITGTFVDKNGNKLANSKVRVNINGKAVYVKTDSNGTYTYSEMITVKTIKYNVYYGGSANYNSYTSSKTTITVA